MNKKILIVEDDHTQNEVLANFLRKENYEVFSAYNISEAKAAINDTFHLVVLDLMLPDGSGLGFLKELRKSSNIPVIVLTALNDEFTQIQSFDLKADEYVDKPVSPVVMVKRISALIERVYGNDEIITIHGYQFDFNNDQRKYLTECKEQLEKSIQLTKELLDFSRNSMSKETEDCNLYELFKEGGDISY